MRRLATLTAAAAFAVALGFTSVAQAADVNLSGWTEETYPTVTGFSDPIWALEGGNLAVKQTVNAQPTVFFSDFNAQGFTIEGVIEVQTTGDDDFIGFALGFEAGDASDTGADYLLVDWKQGTQSFNFNNAQSCPAGGTALAGLAVSRVTGIPTADEFWQHINAGCNTDGGVVELQRGATLGATGWSDNTTVTFKFEFTATNLKVSVNGTPELDIDGVFPDGRIAFYNFSQANVRYSAFTRDGIVKELTSGPDEDGDGEIDVVVPTLTFPDNVLDPYDFTITYVPEDDTDVLIVDAVPAEWQVVEIEGVGPNDQKCFVDIPDGEGGLADAGPGNDKCDREKSATIIEWTPVPTVAVSDLNVVVDTRQSPSGKTKFKPTACGPLFLNDGAIVLELPLPTVGDPVVVAGPSNSLCLAAVDNPGTGTGDRSATADHDTDTLASFAEACTNVPRSDPCLPDTDGDGVNDNVDNCPLISNAAGQGDDADSDGVGLVCDADDANDTIGVAQCADGIDNDGDGRIDHFTSALSDKGGDTDCSSPIDDDESA